MNKACLVNQSTIMRMEVWLLEAGSCSMKSMDMESQGLVGIRSCFNSLYGLCQVALDLAQVVHDFTYHLIIPPTPLQ